MGAVVCRGEVGECALKKNSDGTSLPEERACLDCLMSKKPAEVGLQGTGRFIHHVQSQHLLLQGLPLTAILVLTQLDTAIQRPLRVGTARRARCF